MYFKENNNGVKVSENEYKFINEFYGPNFFEKMTLEEYQWINDLDLNENEYSIESYFENSNLTRETSHSTNSKKISIAKGCNEICTIILKAEWFTNSKIRSYDVIGARLYNISLAKSEITTKLSSSDGIQFINEIKKTSNGFGVSVKLPTSATSIRIEQKFYTTNGGTIFGSYQHATKNISLATSKLYNINSSGEGYVFDFYGAAIGKYDQMGGVNIQL